MRASRSDRPFAGAAAAAIWLPLQRALMAAVVTAGVTMTAVLTEAAPAEAAPARFLSDAFGESSSQAQAVPQALPPTVVVTGRDATASWSATSLSGGTLAERYIVRRYTVGGVPQTVLSSCNSAVTGTSCTENDVPPGTWRYSIQAASGSWVGAESPLGSSITVGDASLTVTPSTLSALPATLSGTISNFTSGETLTFRLDSPTGPELVGSPAVVPSGGTETISVTVPSGTSDAPHSIFAVGSTGTVASAAISIVDPPTLTSLAMVDMNGNGKVDRVFATFDEPLAPYAAGTAPWTLTSPPSGGTLSEVTVTGPIATLTIAEGASAATTAVGSFRVALASNSAGIRDANGHLATFGSTAPADQAPPAALTAVMQDAAPVNGKVDRVVVTFSETLATYSAGTSPWALTGAPSGGSLASVAASGTTATLTLSEGVGPADTAVGSFVVTLSADAAGVRDAAGNQTSFSRAPSDGAKPARVGGEMFDDDADARVDRVVVTFSEPLAAYSAPNSVWALTSAPSGATLSSVSVAGTQATLALTEGTGTATTAVGSFRTALTANAAGIRDAAGNLTSYAAIAPTDRAKPVLLSLNMLDATGGNGKVDRITAVFSEVLTTYTAGTSPWTLTSVPSGGTLASVSVSSATATLTITEGAGAADTTLGALTVALSANAAGIRDVAANLASFAATAPLDRAGPASVTITDTGGSTEGRIDPGDTLAITFSEPLNTSTVPASATVSLTDPIGTGNDTLAITGILNGERTTTTNAHITLEGTSAAFSDSAVVISNGNRTVTITVGPTCSGTGCAAIGTVTSATSLSFLGATTLLDVAGNRAATTARTYSIRLF